MDTESAALFRELAGAVNRVVGALEGLDDARARWRAALADANSLLVIASHVLANAERNVLGTYGGEPYIWDRAGEFDAAGSTVQGLMGRWVELRQRMEAALDRAGAARLGQLREHPRLGPVQGRAVLLRAVSHAAEHVGEATLTRKLLEAAGNAPGASGAHSASPGELVGSDSYVVGVDGCRIGWVTAAVDSRGQRLRLEVLPDFRSVLAAFPEAAALAVDIPIGLSDGPPRACDARARKALGPRASSVFSAPCRQTLASPDYAAAKIASIAATSKSMSIQAFGILPKVREVDEGITPELQARVREAHPELSFKTAAGRDLLHAKRTPEGFEERRQILRSVFPQLEIPARREVRGLAPGAAPDDVLDAVAVAWTALRVANGEAWGLPEPPEVDPRGLRMQITV